MKQQNKTIDSKGEEIDHNLRIPVDQKKLYSSPRILSAEQLEAAAATCSAGGTLGKSDYNCLSLGS
jgi:hypothetical protein